MTDRLPPGTGFRVFRRADESWSLVNDDGQAALDAERAEMEREERKR